MGRAKEIFLEAVYSLEEKQRKKMIFNDLNGFINFIISKIRNELGEIKENEYKHLIKSVLHYLLIEYMIPSERDVKIKDIVVDILIPSRSVLEENPKDCILIFIESKDVKEIESMLNKNSIIFVLSKNYTIKLEDYKIYYFENDMAKFINDIKELLKKKFYFYLGSPRF